MYDNICKLLIEKFPTDFATWLLGKPVLLTELSPTELSLEPIRADAVLLLQSIESILHVEFQTRPDPEMPFRMLDYCLRIHRKFPGQKLHQVVIYLTPSTSADVFKTTFELSRTRHEFDVIRMWEQPTDNLLSQSGLLPLAVLSKTDDCAAVLRQVSNSIERIEDPSTQRNIAAAADILAGLVLNKEAVRKILRTELMKESVTYQAIKEEGREEGREEGAHFLAIQMLSFKLGPLPEEVKTEVMRLSIAQLTELGLATASFASTSQLTNWLQEKVS